jgi:hypothetical protein
MRYRFTGCCKFNSWLELELPSELDKDTDMEGKAIPVLKLYTMKAGNKTLREKFTH